MRIYHRLHTWLCRDAGAASPPAFSAWPRHTRAPGPSAGRSPYWRAGSAGSLNRIPGKNLPKYYFSKMVTNTVNLVIAMFLHILPSFLHSIYFCLSICLSTSPFTSLSVLMSICRCIFDFL